MTERLPDFHEDYYRGFSGIYFRRILRTIVSIGDLTRRPVTVLDYGCGTGRLKKLLGGKVVGYDVLSDLSDVSDWRAVPFDVVVANEVFYLFTREQLEGFLDEVRRVNPRAELIVGISRQGLLNNVAKRLARFTAAHAGTNLSPAEERETLESRMRVTARRGVWFMCDVLRLSFP